MYIGAHVSAAGGLENAPKNGEKIGCEAIQFFSRPPQGGKPKPILTQDVERFKTTMHECQIKAAYIHAPYFINLASSEARIRHGSHSILREELERGSLLGCKAMMFHPGSAKGVDQDKAVQLVIDGINKIMDGYTGYCQLLIEISAGAGMVMGDTFEEIATFINESDYKRQVGVCFDTQHAFASGYDLRTKETFDETFALFEKIIGLKKLVACHVNDSKVGLSERKDRHEHLGKGNIGLSAFERLVTSPHLQNIDLILETPLDEKRAEEIKKLKSLRT